MLQEEQNKKVVKVSQEDSDFLESLQFEVNSYQSLLEFMISGGINIDNDNFRKYHNEYIAKHTAYETAKREVSSKYLGEWQDKSEWSLNFETGEIIAKKVK